MTLTDKLNEMLAVAEQATPGPYEWQSGYGDHGGIFYSLLGKSGTVIDGETGCVSDEDGDYLEALDPAVFSALVRVAVALEEIMAAFREYTNAETVPAAIWRVRDAEGKADKALSALSRTLGVSGEGG